MLTNSSRRPRAVRASLLLSAVVALQLSLAGTAAATDGESYSIAGYEVWFAPTVGVFAGTGNGSAGQLTAWYSSIEHSGVISPSGSITGGWATLYHQDGTRISGWFAGGTVELVDPGAGCTAETHVVQGDLFGVTRSGGSSAATAGLASSGRGTFEATLVHHRAWLFGRCITYSASANGTISLFP